MMNLQVHLLAEGFAHIIPVSELPSEVPKASTNLVPQENPQQVILLFRTDLGSRFREKATCAVPCPILTGRAGCNVATKMVSAVRLPKLAKCMPSKCIKRRGGGAIRAPAVKLVLAYKMLVHPSRRFSSILLRNSPQTMWYLPNCFVIWYLFICWEALLNLPFSIQILKLIAKDGSSNDSCFLFQLARRRFEKIQCMERLQLREPTEI